MLRVSVEISDNGYAILDVAAVTIHRGAQGVGAGEETEAGHSGKASVSTLFRLVR